MSNTNNDTRENMPVTIIKIAATLQIVLLAAIFGFFYAFFCTVMWGLDGVDGKTAIRAMQGINEAVRNPWFAPSFFGPLPLGLVIVVVCWLSGLRKAAAWFALSLALYALGAFVPTVTQNVPMNRTLAEMPIPNDLAQATTFWLEWSARWQWFNTLRTAFSGLALVSALIGLLQISRNRK